jgi:hypothetical protein
MDTITHISVKIRWYTLGLATHKGLLPQQALLKVTLKRQNPHHY